MPCKAPHFLRVATCPGPDGQPATSRCQRCARGLCEASSNNFDKNCKGPNAKTGEAQCAICKLKSKLGARRGSISGMMPTTKGMDLQKAWTGRVDILATELFQEAMLTNAPCNYAICLAGSAARNEASPYSDLDCFILVDDDSPTKVDYFKQTAKRLSDLLVATEAGSGLRLCNIMTPLGDPTNAKAPALILKPDRMAGLLEWPKDQIEGHITGGLQEHRFLMGTQSLYNGYKADLNLIMATTCFRFASRPALTRGKQMGLKVIKDVVNNPKFKPPKRTDKEFHVKEQFYRPVQFLSKGLAWYYGIDAVSTDDQLTALRQGNHMSTVAANNFKAVMNAMAKLRFKLHLDGEGERDFVYLDKNARDTELNALKLKSNAKNEHERERQGRLQGGTLLTPGDVQDLVGCIGSLTYLMDKAKKFATEKDKLLGKRENPFAL